jgi:hypothetical protein
MTLIGIVVLALALLAACSSSGESEEPNRAHPSIALEPLGPFQDGEQVSSEIAGFKAEEKLVIRVCARRFTGMSDSGLCGAEIDAVADSAGGASVVLQLDVHLQVEDGTANCLTAECVVIVAAVNDLSRSATVPISFHDEPLVTSVSDNSVTARLVDRQSTLWHYTMTFVGFPVSDQVTLVVCGGEGDAMAARPCDWNGATNDLPIEDSTTYEVTFPVHPSFTPASGDPIDCLAGTCVIVVLKAPTGELLAELPISG